MRSSHERGFAASLLWCDCCVLFASSLPWYDNDNIKEDADDDNDFEVGTYNNDNVKVDTVDDEWRPESTIHRDSSNSPPALLNSSNFWYSPLLFESFFCIRLFFFDEHTWAIFSGLLAIKASFQRPMAGCWECAKPGGNLSTFFSLVFSLVCQNVVCKFCTSGRSFGYCPFIPRLKKCLTFCEPSESTKIFWKMFTRFFWTFF